MKLAILFIFAFLFLVMSRGLAIVLVPRSG